MRRCRMTDKPAQKMEVLDPAVRSFSLDLPSSRRQFLRLSGISIVGISALGPVLARGEAKPLIILEQAHGIVVSDPVKCVGCGRCELACTEFNDGKASPALSRIKVDRNLNFGPKGVPGWRQGLGNWGNGLVVQDLCKECNHPVPCADACPEDAITVSSPDNTRVVNPERCTGCKICLRACPWEMISFDPDSRKATKCFLCDGKPKCVEACPAESLSYVPWRDLTSKIPYRVATLTPIPPKKETACYECHLPGAEKTLRRGILHMLGEAVKGGKPFSVRESGFKWIDLVGVVLLPLVVVFVIVHAGLRAVVKR
jgi:Fe-S-cluster-containing dehydrogenase component